MSFPPIKIVEGRSIVALSMEQSGRSVIPHCLVLYPFVVNSKSCEPQSHITHFIQILITSPLVSAIIIFLVCRAMVYYHQQILHKVDNKRRVWVFLIDGIPYLELVISAQVQ